MGSKVYFLFVLRKAFRVQYLFFFGVIITFYFSFSWWGILTKGRVGQTKAVFRFFDVGQGDAVFMQSPGGGRILIDGGPGSQVVDLLKASLPFGDRRLDLVILTHPHADHVAGLTHVLDYFEVRNVLLQRSAYDTRTYQRFLDSLEAEKRRGAKVFEPHREDKIRLGRLTLRVLWLGPPQFVTLQASEAARSSESGSVNPNNQSIVLEASYDDFDVFLPGDQEASEARTMLEAVDLRPVEVLKVAHHGSANGLSQELLSQLRPDLAVISVGRSNAYDHPHGQTLKQLDGSGAKVLRTDLDGTIEITSDGKEWGIKLRR